MPTEMIKTVGIAEVHTAKMGVHFECTGIGASVCICAFDPKSHTSGVAFIILPESHLEVDPERPAKFANHAVPYLIDAMIAEGANEKSIRSVVIGGSELQSNVNQISLFNIGLKTVTVSINALKQAGIKVNDQITGGTSGRTVSFDTTTGKVTVRSLGETDTQISDLSSDIEKLFAAA